MNELYEDGSEPPVKYTIRIDIVADMPGYVVEVLDKYNSEKYTLSGIFMERSVAVREANAFVNDLFEKEISMFIN